MEPCNKSILYSPWSYIFCGGKCSMTIAVYEFQPAYSIHMCAIKEHVVHGTCTRLLTKWCFCQEVVKQKQTHVRYVIRLPWHKYGHERTSLCTCMPESSLKVKTLFLLLKLNRYICMLLAYTVINLFKPRVVLEYVNLADQIGLE